MRRTLTLVAVCSLLAPNLTAQTVSAAPDSGVGRIRGTLYDSLMGAPLAGARVALLDGTRIAQTDRLGRFVLDSVPAGPHVVTFRHPALDSIGLTSMAPAVTVRAGAVETVPLAVPSHATFWRSACAAARPSWADSGIVIGTIRDAESGEPLSGARAAVSWLEVRRDSAGRWHPARAGGEVWADSLGTYRFCGAPVEYLVTARGRAGPFSSGAVDVLVGPRGVARRDLAVSMEVLAASDSVAPAADRGLATVAGTVRGERGGLLPGAVVSLDDGRDTARADSAGRFVLPGLPSGSHMLMVRRVGYFAWRSPVDLRNRDTARVDVGLQEALMLDTIRVAAVPWLADRLQEIERRRLSGFGYVFGMSDIRRYPRLSAVLEGIPSVTVQGTPYDFTLWAGTRYSMLGGFCRMRVFIDGLLADEEELASLLPRQVLVIEVYPRQGTSLIQYQDPLRPCGVVLVWTALAR